MAEPPALPVAAPPPAPDLGTYKRDNDTPGVVRTAAAAPAMDPQERDYLIRTVVGEAASEPMEGQQAVANVVLTRVKNGWGKSVKDVVLAPWQFEPWMTKADQLMKLSPSSPEYRKAAIAVDVALAGGNDPTKGADHFLNPEIVRQRTGGRLPSWAQGQPTLTIGGHAFFASGDRPSDFRVAARMADAPQTYQRDDRLPGPALPETTDLRVPSTFGGFGGQDTMVGDAADDYLQYRQVAAADDVISQEMARQQAAKAAAQSPDAALGEKAAPLPEAAPGSPAAPGVVMPEAALAGRREEDLRGSLLHRTMQTIKEAPLQAVGGVFDAARNLMKFGDYLGDQLTELTGVGSTEGGPFEAAANAIDAANPAGKPGTPGGAVIRGITNFAAPFAAILGPASKLAKWAGLEGKTGAVVSGAAAGAVTGATALDPFEEGISNLIQEVPALQSPITEYLAADPNDSEGEARLKKGIEAAGFGALTDGMVMGFRYIRNWIAAKRGAPTTGTEAAAKEAEQATAEAGGAMPADAFKVLGDASPDAPLISIRTKAPTPADKMATATAETAGIQNPAFIAGAPGKATGTDIVSSDLKDVTPGPSLDGKDIFINYAKIETDAEIKAVIGRMAKGFAPQITEAARGVQTNEATAALAKEMGLSVDDLLSRTKGQPFNAETALAARQMLTASGAKLLETAKIASGPNATPADLYAFRRMMALHYAIQTEVIAARTETARALQSWAIPAGVAEQTKALEALLSGAGGGEVVSREMAKRIADIGATSPQALALAVRQGWGAKTVAGVRTFYINALLSSPTTHAVNVISNAAVAAQQVFERSAARGISALRGGDTGVASGEATAMMFATVRSIQDGLRYAAKTAKTGDSSWNATKVEQAMATPEVNAMATQTGFGRAVSYMGRFLPTRMMGAEDEFFKVVGYRAEAAALAVRQATREGLTGDAYKLRVKDLIDNPPESIRLEAADAALYRTFNQRLGKAGQGLMQWRENIPGGWLLLPFVRTPSNIFKYGMERSPLAPIMKSWREDFAAGGARQDLALARAATGSAIMMAVADYADRGVITGYGPDDPGDPSIRERWLRTHQPFSVKIGDTWHSYSRADPLGMTLSIAASFNEQLSRLDVGADSVETVNATLAGGLTAISDAVVNKTYLQGISQFMDAINEPERSAPGYIDRLLSGFVPAISGAVERAYSPQQSQPMAIGDSVLAKIAGLSDSLPPRRDLWGSTLPYESGMGSMYDAVTPFQAQKMRSSPVDQEMERLDMGVKSIPKKVEWDGVPINFRDWPKVYDEYVRLAGNGVKDPAFNMGAKEYLDALVTGKHPLSAVYRLRSDGDQGGKAGMIRDTISRYRQMARAKIMADPKFADFNAYVQKLKNAGFAAEMAPLMGTGGVGIPAGIQ